MPRDLRFWILVPLAVVVVVVVVYYYLDYTGRINQIPADYLSIVSSYRDINERGSHVLRVKNDSSKDIKM